VDVRFKYDVVRKESNGKEYMVPEDFKLSFDTKGMTMHLENLFNGDKFLGKCGHTCTWSHSTHTDVWGRAYSDKFQHLCWNFVPCFGEN
jgi:hypothetical protein